MTSLKLALSVSFAAATSLGCVNAPIYFNGPAPIEVNKKDANGMAITPNRVTDGFALRFRRPTSDEQKALDARSQAMDPADTDKRVPWVSRDKVHLELLFTVTNVDKDPGTFDVLVDGATEYTKYDETVVAMAIGGGDDEPVYYPLMNLHPAPLPATLAPGAVYQGILREDDFFEGEADLDAMGRFVPDKFASLLLNRSEVKPEDFAMVPADVVTPALVEVDVTLTSDKNMTCEWSLRVRDDDDRLLHVDGDHLYQPNPTLFVPMVAAKP